MRDFAAEHRARRLITPAQRAERMQARAARNAELAAAGAIAWSTGNSKMQKLGTLSFGIPAGVAPDGFDTCPAKGICAGYCYARQGFYVWPHVLQAQVRNLAIVRAGLDRFVELAIADLKERRPPSIRIHDSGDFFSAEYLLAWLTIAASLPSLTFYTYTKMFWRLRALLLLGAPANFVFVQSFGGQDDDHLDLSRPHARVFTDHATRQRAGYVDGTETDAPAIAGAVRIGLVYHGSKPLTEGQRSRLTVLQQEA